MQAGMLPNAATLIAATPEPPARGASVRGYGDAQMCDSARLDLRSAERLRPGQHDGARLRERVLAMQRERLRRSMLELASEHGLQGCTITELAARAGVRRTTFYQLYDDLPACFLDTLALALDRATSVVVQAFERESSWSDGILAALAALLALLDAEPALARVCLHEALAGRAEALELRARRLAELPRLLGSSDAPASADNHLAALTAEGAVAATAAVLHTRLVTGEAPPFRAQLAPLAAIALMPYLDASALADALGRVELHTRTALPPPVSASPPRTAALPAALSHPTSHRARAAIRHLAANPGASNREVAASLGIRNLGQASALLARLHRHQLLVKQTGGAGRPNAWTLSPAGEHAARELEEEW